MKTGLPWIPGGQGYQLCWLLVSPVADTIWGSCVLHHFHAMQYVHLHNCTMCIVQCIYARLITDTEQIGKPLDQERHEMDKLSVTRAPVALVKLQQ